MYDKQLQDSHNAMKTISLSRTDTIFDLIVSTKLSDDHKYILNLQNMDPITMKKYLIIIKL